MLWSVAELSLYAPFVLLFKNVQFEPSFASNRDYLNSVRKLNESFSKNISQERPNNCCKSATDHKALYS